MKTLLLLDAPSAPPPLTLARLELDRLQFLHDRTLLEAEAAGESTDLETSDHWRAFLRRLQAQRSCVTLLEAHQAHRDRPMPDVPELLEGVRL